MRPNGGANRDDGEDGDGAADAEDVRPAYEVRRNEREDHDLDDEEGGEAKLLRLLRPRPQKSDGVRAGASLVWH